MSGESSGRGPWVSRKLLATFVVGAACTVGVAAGGVVDARGSSQNGREAQWLAEYEALQGNARATESEQFTEGADPIDFMQSTLTEGVDLVYDPTNDVPNGGGDITGAGIETTPTGAVRAGLAVDVYQDPLTTPDWVLGNTYPGWQFDTNLDGVADYSAEFYVDGSQFYGGVFDAGSNFVCPVTVLLLPADSLYAVEFGAACIGNPAQFRWRAGMTYDDVSLALVQVDFAPDSGWVGPTPTVGYVPLTPARLADTRGSGVKVGSVDGSAGPLVLNVLNNGGLPGSGVGAVALNVTVAEGEGPNVGVGYVTVYPCGTRPNASNLNFVSGQTIPNAVIAPVSSAGDVCFYVYGKAHLLVDVSGYFAT